MNERGRVLVPAFLLFLLLSTVLGLRTALRGLALPFAGLERLANSPRPDPLAEEDDIKAFVRTVDWDEAPPAAPVAPRNAGVPPIRRSSAPRAARVLLSDLTAAREAAFVAVHRIELAEIRSGSATDIDSLASTLSLSASQKERISALMKWRVESLEGLKDEEKRTIEDRYRAAVALELDNGQREKFQEMKSGATLQLGEYLLRTAETTRSRISAEWLKATGNEK